MAATQSELDILKYIAANSCGYERQGSWGNHYTLPGPCRNKPAIVSAGSWCNAVTLPKPPGLFPDDATMAFLAKTLGATPGQRQVAGTAKVDTSYANVGPPPGLSHGLSAALDVHGLPNGNPPLSFVNSIATSEDTWEGALSESDGESSESEEGEWDLAQDGFVKEVSSARPHPGRKCKPCAFYHTKGCTSGSKCQFCHMCSPRQKKRKKRLGRRERAARKEREQGALPVPYCISL